MGRVIMPAFKVETFGTEAEPLVIIDGFSADFEALRRTAEAAAYAVTSPHYPGVRAQADARYLAPQMPLLTRILTEVFGLSDGAVLVECAFSIVTTPPADLSLIQRLPHFDSTDPKRLALLHYFGDEVTGGTAFYRHKATGFETITAPRHAPYTAALAAQMTAHGPPAAAYYQDGPLYERLGAVAARPAKVASVENPPWWRWRRARTPSRSAASAGVVTTISDVLGSILARPIWTSPVPGGMSMSR